MFKMSQSQTYFWPVALNMPASGGKYEKSTFDVEYLRLPQSRILEMRATGEQGLITDAEVCREIVKGWKGILDESGDEMPFSETNLSGLLDVALVAGAIVKAYFESMSGIKQKN
jgi:hypothetical protein